MSGRASIVRTIGAGVAGGCLAGAAIGVAEALAAFVHAHGAGELPAIGWALAAYGGLGAAVGLGLGLVAAVLGTDGFALALAGVGAGLGLVVGRFRVIRDVFLEQAPRGPVALAVQLAAVIAVFALAVLVWRALRSATARGGALTRPLVALLVVALAAVAWGGGTRLRAGAAPPTLGQRPAAAAGAPNVILIMVDTLRADHLGAYGGKVAATPHVDALARDGLLFANTYSQASWTRASVATILTGLYPSSHGAVHKADALPDRVETLAEMLRQGGYYTAGLANNANVSPTFNFQQGYDDYRYLAPALFFGASEQAAQLALYSTLRLVKERFLSSAVDVRNYYHPAEDVTAEVRRWLDAGAAADRPFFLFVHYMDPHDPYMAHPFDGEGYARVKYPNPPPAMAERFRALYAGEVAYLDQHLGALFDDLKRRGLYDRTLIVLTADHGEEFHEHGGWWHGTTLYDEQIAVPLIVKPAGRPVGRTVDEFATHLDIVPTVLAAAGLKAPDTLQGHVLPLDGGAAPSRQSVFAEEDFEGNVLQAARTREWKLVSANPGNPRGLAPEELYDVASDPGEQKNVVGTAVAAAEQMRAELGKSYLVAREHAGAVQQGGSDAATEERLRALGYVGDAPH